MNGHDIIMFAIGGLVSVATFVFVWSLGAAARRGDDMTADVLRHEEERSS